MKRRKFYVGDAPLRVPQNVGGTGSISLAEGRAPARSAKWQSGRDAQGCIPCGKCIAFFEFHFIVSAF